MRRAASALDRQARPGLQADARVGRLLARRRQERPAPAHLRHRLGDPGPARQISVPAGRGREARPSPDRPRDGPVPSAGRSRRVGVLASQGLDPVPHHRALYARPARGRRLCRGQNPAADRPRAVGGLGPLGEIPGAYVHRRVRGADAGAEADELPRARSRSSARASNPIATCRCAWPSSAAAIATSRRARCTASSACAASPRTMRISSAPTTR